MGLPNNKVLFMKKSEGARLYERDADGRFTRDADGKLIKKKKTQLNSSRPSFGVLGRVLNSKDKL